MSDLISFALVQLKPGVTPQTAPNALGAGDVGGTTAIQNRAFVAIAGDGDKILESGETGYVLSGVRSSNYVSNTGTLNGSDDPVQIKVHGRVNNSTVGALSTDTALGFNPNWGFGVDNGPDGGNRNLNDGDSITWTLNQNAGVPQRLQAVSFTVDRGTSTGMAPIAIDFDGDVVRGGTYQPAQTAANANRALEFSAGHNAVVAIDFDARTLKVDGAARTGADIDAFFAAYDVSPKNVLTIGGTGAGFSVRDLVLQRTDYAGPPQNQPPTAVTLANAVTSLAETADTTTAIKVADIVVTDDGVGRNDLSLAGADAGLFTIVDGAGGKELHLKAGAALDFETRSALSVTVAVDNAGVGASPDATTTFNLGVTDANEAGISFALVQLKPGVTPQTAPNPLGAGDVGGTTAIQNRAFVAIAGDGDKILESGETGYVLSGVRSSNYVSNTGTLNGSDDPVQIKVHGRVNNSTVGALSTDTALGFNPNWGFGVDNGPDGGNRNLNGGDSITWTLNQNAGVPQRLQAVSFTVDRGTSTGTTPIAIDFDGDVVRSGTYQPAQTAANANRALEFSAGHNAVVAIDFDARTLTVNGQALTDPAAITAFFAAYDVSPKNVLTIGGTGAGFSVRDLVLQRTDYADNDVAPLPTVSIGDVQATEGGQLVFTVTASAAADAPITATYTISFPATGAASAGDLAAGTLLSGTVTIPAGETTATVSLDTLDDALVESAESVVVTLSNFSANAVAGDVEATGAIADNDVAPLPTVSIGDVQATEGGQLVFTVTASAAAATLPITATYTISFPATGAASADDLAAGTLLSGTVEIPAGETTATVSLDTLDDALVESAESVVVTLSNFSANAVAGDVEATGAIADNDVAPLPTVSIGDVQATEGGQLVFTVTASAAAATLPITATYTISFPATGAASADDLAAGTLLTGTVTIPAGETTATVSLGTLDDALVESAESVVVTLSNFSANAVAGDVEATGAIADNDVAPLPTVSIGDVQATEGGQLVFTVTASAAAATLPITATYTISFPATGAASADDLAAGTLLTGTVTIPAGETTATVSLGTLDDALVESAESVVVTLSNFSANAVAGDVEATGAIADNDVAPLPTVSIGDVQATEGGQLVFTVTASAAAATLPITATYTISFPATGAASADDLAAGTLLTGTVEIPAGETTATVSLGTLDDALVESAESVVVTLSNFSANAVAGDVEATGAIADNDVAPLPTVSIGDVQATEGGQLVFTVTASAAAATLPITATYTISFPATGAASADDLAAGTLLTGTVEIPAGETTATVSLGTLDDALVESAESVVVTLSQFSANAVAGDVEATGAIADNDVAPTIALTPVVTTLAETANTTTSLKVADIVVTDPDGVGTNTLGLAGANADLFAIVDGTTGGKELHLKAGTVLDYETLASLAVTVAVDDASLGATPDATADFTLAITDVQETYGTITLDGSIGEWAPAARLDAPINGTAGYALYGSYQAEAFVLALQAPAAIGPNTTLWFNTDLNAATGHQIFGPGSGGAEYNINFGADGRPALYTGADGQTLVSDALPFRVSADGTVVEIALPSTLVGGARSANLLVDVNNTVFLPIDYASGGYRIGENSAPTIALTPVVTTLAETANTTTSIRVADIVVTDPDGVGTNTLGLEGANANLFTIVDGASGGKELHLQAGTVLDFETLASLSVTVTVDDAALGTTGPDATAPFTLAISDVKETYGTITLDGALADWAPTARLDAPGTVAAGHALYGSYQDEAFVLALQAPVAIGPNTTLWFNTDLRTDTGFQIFGQTGIGGAEYNINFGPDGRAALYSGDAGQTLVSDALAYNFSADRTVLEIALPSTLVGGARSAELFADVNNTVFLPGVYDNGGYGVGENNAPTIVLTAVVSELAENANTTTSIKVADITVTDPDGVGTNVLSLTGTNADLFAIVDNATSGGKELHLKAGTTLDFETLTSLSVSVAVDDTSTSTTPDATSAPFTLAITDVKETYGTITLDGALADWAPTARLDAPGTVAAGHALYGSYQDEAFVLALQAPVAIGPNTTLWFNTDLRTDTGFQIFGRPNVGGAEYNINFGPDGRAALYSGDAGQTLVSDALAYNFSADRTVLEIALPSTLVGGARRADLFADVNNTVFLPTDYAAITGSSTGYRIGEKPPLLPTDPALKVAFVYSETSANAFYDKTAYGQLFMAAQNQAYQAGIPFDVISEDALTDIANLVGYDAIVFPGLSHVKAANLPAITTALTSASKDYGIGLIAAGNFLTNDETGAAIAGDSYARMKSLLGVTLEGSGATTGIQLKAAGVTHPVTDLYGSSEVVGNYGNNSYLYFQDVSGNGQTLFSQQVTGGNLSAVIANTNGGRNVHFASDAIMGNNNILSEALNWSARGGAPDVGLQMTRGTSLFFSRNDMDQSQEYFDVVETNPGIYDAMNPIVEQWYRDYGFVGSYYINIGNNPPDQRTDWSISGPHYQQLLALESEIGTHSYTHPEDTNLLNAAQIQFEFQQSKSIIEQQLGISMAGAAVPGAPEKLPASLLMIQYFNYLSGGYSATGAGYPGAFGFLTPDHADKVYFAPNVSFDFSLIEFRNLTAAQAEAVWTQEYNAIVEKGSTPIIHWPWHDYGPTEWDLGEGNPGYTLGMFTNFIQRAYTDGTEFVTGADLARRIESFVATDIQISEEGGNLVAMVTGSDVGKFALETHQAIASVDNWYAFDGTKVFLPKGGGTFTITPGSQEADVTRIAELPMRAELVSANGNGTDLDFTLNGRGDVEVDLKAWGSNSVIATGADSGSLSGEVLKLSFANLGSHSVNIDYAASATVSGTAGNNVLIGGGGADTFVYSVGGGIDTILDFAPAEDKIQLVGSGFASAAEAAAAFLQEAGGLTLSFDDDRLVLANTTQIGEEHILLA